MVPFKLTIAALNDILDGQPLSIPTAKFKSQEKYRMRRINHSKWTLNRLDRNGDVVLVIVISSDDIFPCPRPLNVPNIGDRTPWVARFGPFSCRIIAFESKLKIFFFFSLALRR